GGGVALLETLGVLGLAQRLLALVPGAQFGADDVAVAIGVDGVEVLHQHARHAALAGDFVARDAAVAIGVEAGDAARMLAVVLAEAVLAEAMLARLLGERGAGRRGR